MAADRRVPISVGVVYVVHAVRPSVLSIRSDIQIITLIVTNVRMAPCVTSSSTTSTNSFYCEQEQAYYKPGRHRRRRDRYRATGQPVRYDALCIGFVILDRDRHGVG